jgi:hypothetical protein
VNAGGVSDKEEWEKKLYKKERKNKK